MAESTKGKKRTGSKSGASGKKRTPGGSESQPRKKKKHSGKLVEMTGAQLTLDEVIDEKENGSASPRKPSRKKQKEDSGAPEPEVMIQLNEEKTEGQNEESNDQNIWRQQTKSIVIWLGSVILLALTFLPGESGWTIAHNIILGILGFKAFLWAALLIYSGYLYARQYDRDRIQEIVWTTAVLIFLTDVMCYILFQSNGYRDVFNELSFGPIQLFVQIFHDGAKIGGTGLLGGFLGEVFLAIAGKNGAIIITSLLIIAVTMLLSHTGPVALFDDLIKKFLALFDPETYRALARRLQPEETEEIFDIDPDREPFPEESGEYFSYPDEENTPAPVFAFDEDEEGARAGDSSGDENMEPGEEAALEEEPAPSPLPERKRGKISKSEQIKAERDAFEKQVDMAGSSQDGSEEKPYRFPPLRLLYAPDKTRETLDDSERETMGATLLAALEEHKIKASISEICSGPTVTRFEITPASGVRINQITSRSKDIALRLAAKSIRIEAPIPGKSAVGIEIPNKVKRMVRISEIVGSREFREAKGALVTALGKDIEGNIVLCDLSKMVHLLIAGSTGSGKSVCINAMLISLLYKYSPEEVKMILIDPKSVEFDMYNGIPHLLVPVVCDPKKAAGALQWAVSEMEKRYQMLKEHSVRNIDNYNLMAEKTGEFKKMCRIIIVIDEMADLMLTTPKEVEDSISRLAAKARAAGMHMIFATQRPSVEVITGTIKNNIPSRIALAVSANVDSRTILDEGGAENLIGNGDMLFHPANSNKHTRVQGCFVDDMEVESVIEFVKQNGPAEYDDSIADEIERNSRGDADTDNPYFDDRDENFDRAVETVIEAGQASVSMLQRRLSIGYARAGRIVDQLERYGIVGPSEGSKPRAVLITRAQWAEMSMAQSQPSGNHSAAPVRIENPSRPSYDEERPGTQTEFFESEFDEYGPGFEDEEDDTRPDNVDPASDVTVEIEDDEDTSDQPVRSVEKSSDRGIPYNTEEEEETEAAEDGLYKDSVGSAPRDFSVFFEEEETVPFGDEGGGGSQEASDVAIVPPEGEAVQDELSDVPPWEDPSFSFFVSGRGTGQADSWLTPPEESASSGPTDSGTTGKASAPATKKDADDDDDDDDILSSPWIKRL